MAPMALRNTLALRFPFSPMFEHTYHPFYAQSSSLPCHCSEPLTAPSVARHSFSTELFVVYSFPKHQQRAIYLRFCLLCLLLYMVLVVSLFLFWYLASAVVLMFCEGE